jgi:hypothetical protein
MAKKTSTGIEIPDDLGFVDKHRLDEQWSRHSKLYMTFALAMEEARYEHAKAKAELEVIEARAELFVRQNPTKFLKGDMKMTEAVVSALVASNEKVVAHKERINLLRYDQGVLEGACRTLEQTKAALENMVILHGREYFSDPRDRRPERNGAGMDDVVENRKRAIDRPRTK